MIFFLKFPKLFMPMAVRITSGINMGRTLSKFIFSMVIMDGKESRNKLLQMKIFCCLLPRRINVLTPKIKKMLSRSSSGPVFGGVCCGLISPFKNSVLGEYKLNHLVAMERRVS